MNDRSHEEAGYAAGILALTRLSPADRRHALEQWRGSQTAFGVGFVKALEEYEKDKG